MEDTDISNFGFFLRILLYIYIVIFCGVYGFIEIFSIFSCFQSAILGTIITVIILVVKYLAIYVMTDFSAKQLVNSYTKIEAFVYGAIIGISGILSNLIGVKGVYNGIHLELIVDSLVFGIIGMIGSVYIIYKAIKMTTINQFLNHILEINKIKNTIPIYCNIKIT